MAKVAESRGPQGGGVHSLFGFPKWGHPSRRRRSRSKPGGPLGRVDVYGPWRCQRLHRAGTMAARYLASSSPVLRNADELTAYVDGKSLGKSQKPNKALQSAAKRISVWGFISDYGWPVLGDFRAFSGVLGACAINRGPFPRPRNSPRDDDTVVLLEFTGKGKKRSRTWPATITARSTGGEWVETAVVATDPKPEPKPEPEPVADKPQRRAIARRRLHRTAPKRRA